MPSKTPSSLFPVPPRHGGIDGAREILPEGIPGNEILDFSISINPLGSPSGLTNVLTRALETLHHYPEIASETLCERLASYHALSPEHIIVGNGTTDLLFALIPHLPSRKAIIPYPTFIEYERACRIFGWEICHVPPRNQTDFSFDPQNILSQISPDTTLFLCQPNNPTGQSLDSASLGEILHKAERVGAYVVLDEAFLPFTKAPSSIPNVKTQSTLIVLRSMTKSYGIPGLRLGYAVAAPTLISRWKTHLPPWNVNKLAQTAGIYCLDHGENHLRTTQVFIQKERKRIIDKIQQNPHLTPIPTEVNFFLVGIASNHFTADDLYLSLARRGILVRHCGSFRGMENRHIRIGLKTPTDNQKLLDALQEITQEISLSQGERPTAKPEHLPRP